MIINLPTADALNATALKLYFRAWHAIISILHDFDASYEGDISNWLNADEDSWIDERIEYLDTAQEDLHAILSIVQQSNELALKGRIAEVSPYLLLLNNDVSFHANGADVEFAALRTLDAVDLPKAVNTLTNRPLSTAYVQQYGQLRIQRNQYTHLGDTSIVLNPIDICATMAGQFLELWPDRPWLRERVDSTHGREQFFDGKHWSPRQEIMYLLEYDFALIPAEKFRKLFGVRKSAVQFGCHKCQDDWAVGRNGPGIPEAPTAFYDNVKKAMHCLICDEDFAATTQTCPSECGGNFVAPADAEFGAGKCFSCGDSISEDS